MEHPYPFTAIVGQEQMKLALVLNLINPALGGVLIQGEKGTAKSTAVRGLTDLLEEVQVVEGCPFHCRPDSGDLCEQCRSRAEWKTVPYTRKVVELPVSSTEDRVVGSLNMEQAIKKGEKVFEPGLLAQANGNILYVDEVNLLDDHIVDVLLDSAAMGVNTVEREGVSYSHPARFVLVGTMNPEEGRLRPQFLDRFGLYAEVTGEADLEQRAEIIRRRMAYERDPAAFCAQWREKRAALSRQITQARALAAQMEIGEPIRRLAAQYAVQAGTEGNRCEVVLCRTAAAAAAWAGREHITPEDLNEAAFYVLPHRRREDAPPPEQPPAPPKSEENRGGPEENTSPEAQDPQNEARFSPDGPQMEEQPGNDGEEIETPPPVESPQAGPEEEQLVEGEEFTLFSLLPSLPRDRVLRKGSGRRSRTKGGTNKGRYAAFTAHPLPHQRDLALDATLRAAAPYQSMRDHSDCAVALTDQDLRFKVRENHIGATVVFCVDASGSMGAGKRMKAAKEAVLSMLLDSYQKRDRVGLVAFRGEGIDTLLDITASVDLAEKRLQQLPTGGRTPLAAGLYQSWQLLKARRRKDPELLPLLVLVTDGRANRALWTQDPVEDAMQAAQLIRREGIRTVVIDTERDFISLHIARQAAEALDADYYKVDELRGEQLRAIVKGRTSLLERRD